VCLKELAMARLLQGYSADAVKLLTNALPRATQALSSDHYTTLQIQRVLARAYAEVGQLDEAELVCKQALAVQRRTKANQDGQGAARTQLYLGRILVEKGKLDEAEPNVQDALNFFRSDAAYKPKPELAAQAANWLGIILVARKAYPEAKALMLPVPNLFFAVNAEMSPNERRLAVGHIVALYQACGESDQAALWQKKLETLPPVPTAR
jgi:tetratricopeptide (TPR) repeat protein